MISAVSPSGYTPQVSVVMIFLNAEPFIVQAVDSVLSQTYEQWELLLVDDGSTDTSTAIARRYAETYPEKIRYLEHDGHINKGTGASRNLGIHSARGEYVTFLDADDVYLPQRLERHIDVLSGDHSIGLVISSSLYWHSWLDPAQLALKMRDEIVGVCAKPNAPLEPPELLIVCFTVSGAPIPCPCDITFRRDLALAAGGIPAEFTGQYEDQVLLCQLLLRARVVVLDECLAKYRQHTNSLTARARFAGEYRPGRAHDARFMFVRWLRDHLREHGIHSAELDAQLQRELWPLTHPRLNRLREAVLDAGRGARQMLRNVALWALPRPLLEKAVAYYFEIKRSRLRRRANEASPVNRKRAGS